MSHADAYEVTLGDRGRLVLPAELRKRAGLREGQELILVYADGVIRLATRRELARAGRGAFAGLARGRDLVGELLAERRTEAQQEAKPKPSRRARRS